MVACIRRYSHFASVCPFGLLIPRSKVRSLHGPFSHRFACFTGETSFPRGPPSFSLCLTTAPTATSWCLAPGRGCGRHARIGYGMPPARFSWRSRRCVGSKGHVSVPGTCTYGCSLHGGRKGAHGGNTFRSATVAAHQSSRRGTRLTPDTGRGSAGNVAHLVRDGVLQDTAAFAAHADLPTPPGAARLGSAA
jgi:hypothetical protein